MTGRTRALFTCAAGTLLVLATAGPSLRGQEPGADPFAFLAPAVAVAKGERERLERNEVVARTISSRDAQVAVFVATRLNAQPEGLVAWTEAIAELRRSKFVLQIGRFSDPPVLADLAGLTLDQQDLEAIRRCRPGDCSLKLSAPEIEGLRSAIAGAGEGWREAAQREFRRMLIARVTQYRNGGLAALPPPADRRNATPHDDVQAALIQQSPYLEKLPAVTTWLREYPAKNPAVESFFYWSKEHYGEGKPVISTTHVGIFRPESGGGLPAVVVVGKQIFATHYVEGSLGLTMFLRDAQSGTSYLAYVNRSQVDLLRGFFGRFLRGLLQGRLERQAPAIIQGLRSRLESGAPPRKEEPRSDRQHQ